MESIINHKAQSFFLCQQSLHINSHLCGKFLGKPLAYIFKKSLTVGKFLDCLKYLVVNPLFKKGEKSELTNHRSISLLTGFSKIFELLIYQRLNQHFQNRNIFVTEQYGFRRRLSTINATHKLTNYFKCLEQQ
jgi:hypothetical protein